MLLTSLSDSAIALRSYTYSLAAAVSCFAAVVQCTGCGPSCPSQPTGCYPTTTLLSPIPDGPPAVYEVALRFRSGETEESDRCLAILPPPSDWTANVPASCERNSASAYVVRDVDIDCAVTYPAGASCSARANGFVLTIVRGGRVDDATIQLTQGGSSFSPITIQPAYQTVYPDGPSCPGSCDTSTTVIAFDSLVEPSR